MTYEKFRTLLSPVLYDALGRYCSGRLSKLSFFESLDNDLFKYIKRNLSLGVSISESVYLIFKEKNNKCLCCGSETKYVSFDFGYKRTCHEDKCLKYSYGLNPPVQKEEDNKRCSIRMKLNNPMKNKKTVDKVAATCKLKYPLGKPMHLEENKLKALNSRFDIYGTFSPKSKLFKTKDFILPSGEIVKVQGYEDRALVILLEKYKESDIVCCGKQHLFYYTKGGKKRRYYPDIFIRSENCYIEVKSLYTYRVDLKANLLKRESVLNEGFNFKFMILKNNDKKNSI